ncbi:hypothetical protein AB0N05_18705 [Nocardia sp. NPDC051030]|uniref:hypothetical protein n=1 Tax=Nocardia sp. NPDC051030 TaxID=3155162 RepID=UPI00343810ED
MPAAAGVRPLSAAPHESPEVDECRRSGLPAAADAIVARWNPHGHALLDAIGAEASPGGGEVALIGGEDANTLLLRVELARCAPRVELATTGGESQRRAAAMGDGVGEGVRPAAVALVVLDGGSPIGREMLGVVRGLREMGTRVVFALEGIHAHEEWERVRDRDVELLGGAEVVAVSARMAGVARGLGDGALLDRSGLGLLHARLVAAVGAGAVGDQVGIVRERVVEETRRRIGVQLGELLGGGDVAALREERATLLARGDGGRGAGIAAVRNRLHLARVDLLHEVGVRIRALNAGMRGDIERLGRDGYGGVPGRLQDLVEKLTREVDRATRIRLREVTRQGGQAVGGSGWEAVEGQVGAVVGQVDSPWVGADPEPRCRGVEDHLVVALGASAGFGLGRLLVTPLALVEALEYAIMPVSLLLGAAAAGWVVRARGQLLERSHLQQWVSDALVNVKAQLEQRVATALVEAEERLTDRVVGITAARMVETDRRVGELEAQLRRAAQRRPGLSLACERDLAALECV